MTDEKKHEMNDVQTREYMDMCERIQAGTGMMLKYNTQSGEPKHMVAGNNLRAVEFSALTWLLIEKGIITHEEFHAALMQSLQDEVNRLEYLLTEKMGKTVKLGCSSDLARHHVEPQLAVLDDGETVPIAYLVCPECATVDLHTKYDKKRQEFECPRGHKWAKPKENLKVM